jgi:hypothetical protein
VGYMPNAPAQDALGIGSTQAAADAFAVVAGLDLRPLGAGALGLQLARIPAGYLASPDYPPNTRSVEMRYSWSIAALAMKLDLRYRLRQDLERPAGAVATRTDQNLLLRATVRF